MAWLAQYKYRILLVTLLLLLVGYPLVHDSFEAWLLLDVLLAGVFLAAFHVIFNDRLLRIPGIVLGAPTLVAAWTGYVLPGPPRVHLVMAFHAVAAAFLVFTAATILRGIHRQKVLTADSISGAFCGYLLLGLAFAHVYCLVEIASPGSFRTDTASFPPWHDAGRLRFVLSYFSFCTLTTVGYGDIQPVTATARAFAMAEAITGQFYLAVVIAELIGMRVAQATVPRPGGAAGRGAG